MNKDVCVISLEGSLVLLLCDSSCACGRFGCKTFQWDSHGDGNSFWATNGKWNRNNDMKMGMAEAIVCCV